MMTQHEGRLIGVVDGIDSAGFANTVAALRAGYTGIGQGIAWECVIDDYRGYALTQLDRAGWLALRNLCDQMVAAIDADAAGDGGSGQHGG